MAPHRTIERALIGGGIVGLATAMRWLQRDGSPTGSGRLEVFEAEPKVAAHQSGHNSGVIHSGIYYRPGSEKALLCRRGKVELETFCQKHEIPWEKCGKVIVATHAGELESLEKIAERGRQNGVEFERIHTDRLRELEPAAAGIAALHVPETGIVNYAEVCKCMQTRVIELGGRVHTRKRVVGMEYGDRDIELRFDDGSGCAVKEVIVCGGVQSDRLYRMARVAAAGAAERSAANSSKSPNEVESEIPEGHQRGFQIVPFRGEYYEIVPGKRHLCRNLIYPVPDPQFPFLGVHFTRMIGGGVECGPNAVLALSRNGYRWRDLDPGEFFETVRFAGFRKLAKKHWAMGLSEVHRSVRKAAFVAALRKLIPSIQPADLIAARAGVRAQAVDDSGALVDDFLFGHTPRMTHVINAPSPAATASLAIADRILDQHQAAL